MTAEMDRAMSEHMVTRTFTPFKHRRAYTGPQRYYCSLCRGTTTDPIKHAFESRCQPWWWFGRTEQEMRTASRDRAAEKRDGIEVWP
jgi:hypothetical protein